MRNINLNNDFETAVTYSSNVWNVQDLQYSIMKWSEFLNVISDVAVGNKGDNGVFIGGKVVDRRNDENVVNRSMATIDIDDIPEDFPKLFEHLSKKGNNTFAMYSTHNHTIEKPRYRLVIPFDKPTELTKDQYKMLIQTLAKAYEIPFYDKQSESISLAMNMPTVDHDRVNSFEFYHFEGDTLDIENLKEVLDQEIRKVKLDFANTYEERLNDYRNIARNGDFEGSRNAGLTKLLGHLLNKEVDELMLYELLNGWWHYHRYEHESYTASQKEFDSTFKSIFKKHLQGGR